MLLILCQVLGCHPNEVFGSGLPKYTAAESTSDSTVLDYLSINGLLAQYVQKAGRLPFGYPTGLLAEIAHSFLSVAVLTFKTKYQTKTKHGQQNISAIRALILCVSDVEFILCI